MAVTIILSLILMAALFLMLYAAVALVQDKRLFTSAPKDIQAVILPREERFRGAKAIGIALIVFTMLIFLFAFIYGGYDGIMREYGFWQFFIRFAAMLYLLKAFDILFFDLFLLTNSHFFQHFYPETEGCKGFSSFGFNIKSHLLHMVLFIPFSLAAAWVCTLF